MYEIKEGKLFYRYAKDTVCVEAWGENSLRVRAWRSGRIWENERGALGDHVETTPEIRIESDERAWISNGKIRAEFTKSGLTFYNQNGQELTGERWRGAPWGGPAPFHDPIVYPARSWRELEGGAYRVEQRMNAYEGEKIFGMGQYQDGLFDYKGATLDMRPRNKQASIPFMVSSRGYGFLWNNPAVGRVTFGTNYTQWEAVETKGVDYWVTCGDTPAEIERQYAAVTGYAPMMPEFAMGLWQCKLRYVTQEELMGVAREYKKRGIPLNVIVIDFWHWLAYGDWYLDPKCWPDPEGMCRELKEMGIELAVSVWPTVDMRGEHWKPMYERGLLVETKAGLPFGCNFGGDSTMIDPTIPEARDYLWQVCKRNYFDKGAMIFWLDCAEPEYTFADDFEAYTYQAGSAEMVGNLYPRDYCRIFYDGQRASGVENPISLIRCAWAGSQKYGALLWSGDIDTNWKTMREQVVIGQNVGMAGLPWWTTDIGGFIGGDRKDPAFVELLLRWFEWMTYCPVLRMHGARNGESPEGHTPPNELWSYGDKAYEIMRAHVEKREALRPYIREVMRQAHEKGDPAIRPLFYEFPDDPKAWETPYEHMFGSELLVAPVLQPGVTEIEVYLPKGANWLDERDGKVYEGGKTYTLPAPIESTPVLKRMKA